MANEYKSTHTGEQIDEAVSIVLGEETPESSPLVLKTDIENTTGPNQDKTMSQASITQLIQNLTEQINELRTQIQNLQS